MTKLDIFTHIPNKPGCKFEMFTFTFAWVFLQYLDVAIFTVLSIHAYIVFEPRHEETCLRGLRQG